MDPTREAITAEQPRVIVEKTEAEAGGWRTSGKVQFQITKGRSPSFGALEFPFRNAASEGAAIEQAATQLRTVVDQLTRLLERLTGR